MKTLPLIKLKSMIKKKYLATILMNKNIILKI